MSKLKVKNINVPVTEDMYDDSYRMADKENKHLTDIIRGFLSEKIKKCKKF